MKIVQYEPWHLLRINVQSAQELPAQLGDDYASWLADSGPAWTALDEGGHPVACGGLSTQWSGRAVAWSLIDLRANMLSLTRHAKKALQEIAPPRIEAWVDVDFEPGMRWAEMLGFAHEGRMAKFSPEGRDMHLFARVAK